MPKISQSALHHYRRLRAIHLKQRPFWQAIDPTGVTKRRYAVEAMLGYRWKYARHLMNGTCDYSRYGRGVL